eukprot:Awhi_evm1s15831
MAFKVQTTANLNSIFTYFHIYPIHFIIYLIAMIGPSLVVFKDIKVSLGVSSTTIFTIYALWLVILTWKVRHAAFEFSDALTNCRSAVYIVVLYNAIFVINVSTDSRYMVTNIAYQYVTQSTILIYLFDSILQVLFLNRYKVTKDTGAKNNGASNHLHNTARHHTLSFVDPNETITSKDLKKQSGLWNGEVLDIASE